MLRFYDTDSGSILINGNDIKNYSLEYIRRNIAVVFQNTYLFYGTIRENIMMARPGATEEEMIDAAKSASAHEFIMSLPKGYDTKVSEGGTTLSGGQRQRIAIARAILKNAPILIMDEATSSVDAANELSIQRTIESLDGKYTTIVIAHRLSTIRNANNIVVLKEGRVVEQGSHVDLISGIPDG